MKKCCVVFLTVIIILSNFSLNVFSAESSIEFEHSWEKTAIINSLKKSMPEKYGNYDENSDIYLSDYKNIIYLEYSDITEDNNNDNNSDIVQLNNLYRNNITAKIICNIIVITQYDAIAEAVKTKEIQVLYNPHPEDGISSSVKIGLNAGLDADAVLFTVSDQPWLTSETICELIHVFLNTSKGIACVSCQGKMGNPCIFDRKYYNELLSLEGDKGGKKVIMKHLDDTQIYEIEAGRELEDIDYYESIAVH